MRNRLIDQASASPSGLPKLQFILNRIGQDKYYFLKLLNSNHWLNSSLPCKVRHQQRQAGMKFLTGRRRSGPPWPWLLLLLFLCCPIPCTISQLPQPHAEISCIQFGQGFDGGPFTIGAKPFKPRDVYPSRYTYIVPTDTTQAYKHPWEDIQDWAICPDAYEWKEIEGSLFIQDLCPEGVELRAYLVRQNGRVLRGWLHFEVELTDGDEIQYINFQVKDEHFNTIGEFITKKEEQCTPIKGLISPTEYQILPCSAFGLREAKIGQAVFMVHPLQIEDPELIKPGFLPNEELKRGVAFNWRLNEYWCNRHASIRVDVEVWSKNSEKNFAKYNQKYRNANPKKPDMPCREDYSRGCRMKRKVSPFWLNLAWYGAADIRLDGAGELDCSMPAVDYSNGIIPNGEAKVWLNSAYKMKPGNDVFGKYISQEKDTNHKHTRSCQVDIFPRGDAKNSSDIVTFGGRCEGLQEKTVKHELVQRCNLDENAKEFAAVDKSKFKRYKQYERNLIETRLRPCIQKQGCSAPDINEPKHLEQILKFPKKEKVIPNAEFYQMTRSRAEERRGIFWITRKCHGITCIFLAMFLLPLSTFLARYYKETFTKWNMGGCQFWFGFHVLVCFLAPSFFFATLLPMLFNIDTFGRSKSGQGTFHCQFGYALVGIFMVMVCIGGFRPVRKLPLLVCMAMHSVTGFVLQVLPLVLIYQSSYVPGSPSADECDTESQHPIGFSFVSKMALVRFCMDVFFHLFLTRVQKTVDKKYKIRRQGFGMPIVPILPGTTRKDMVGYRFRKAMLVVYVVLSFGVTFLATWDLWEKDDNGNCTLGEMTCDMSQTLPNMSSSPLGCSSTSLQYYARMLKKYNIDPTLLDL